MWKQPGLFISRLNQFSCEHQYVNTAEKKHIDPAWRRRGKWKLSSYLETFKDERREITTTRKKLAQFYAQPAGFIVRFWFVWRDAKKPQKSRYLNFISIHIQQSLAEVHADGGLHPRWKLSSAQSMCEAGLPHPGVPDHHNLECPVAAQQRGETAT